jgi:hypothetical protein
MDASVNQGKKKPAATMERKDKDGRREKGEVRSEVLIEFPY